MEYLQLNKRDFIFPKRLNYKQNIIVNLVKDN